jgi:hypothetical protein
VSLHFDLKLQLPTSLDLIASRVIEPVPDWLRRNRLQWVLKVDRRERRAAQTRPRIRFAIRPPCLREEAESLPATTDS